MRQSRILVVDGVFLGALVALPEQAGWRIAVTDSRISPLQDRICATPQEAERLARQAFLSSRPRHVAA